MLQSAISWFEGQIRPFQLVVALSFVLLIFVLDYLTGTEISFSIFYLVPIIILSWCCRSRDGITLVLVCAAAWAFADILGGNSYSSPYIFAFNTLVRLGIFLIISLLISKLHENNQKLTKTQLLSQRSYDVITTSQKLVALIAKHIIVHNSNLWSWVVQQKEHGYQVPKIVESTCVHIGANLAALTEICYSYQPIEKEPIDLEKLVNQFNARLENVQDKISDTKHPNTAENLPTLEESLAHISSIDSMLANEHQEFHAAIDTVKKFAQ